MFNAEYWSGIAGYAAQILKGIGITLSIYGVTLLCAPPLALLSALGRTSRFRILKSLLGIYAWLFRGTPLLLQLFFFYFGLKAIGIYLSPLNAAFVAYVLNYTAYLMEIFRAGIESIPKEHYEAASSLNLTYRQTVWEIVLPQAVKRTLPPACNEAITLVKDTALVAAITLNDILRIAKGIVMREFDLTPLLIAGCLYLLFSSIIVRLFGLLEKKFTLPGENI